MLRALKLQDDFFQMNDQHDLNFNQHEDEIRLLESDVRTYCRSLPAVFKSANGSILYDIHGKRYIDFLASAGSLNYGHNDHYLKEAILKYLANDGVVQTLDFSTHAKLDFMRSFNEVILARRGLNYKIQFTGPTGTNAVEAAIKLARKVTGRTAIAAFTNAFHGVSLGALALTGNASKRAAAGVSLADVIRLPYDGYLGEGVNTLAYARKLFEDPSSGIAKPAAFIVETIQGEGGINCASAQWMKDLETLAKDFGALLIVDDIQAGCGRSGTFFSFEEMGVYPDIVCLSKSISGYGLPMAIVLIKPEFDQWQPGEHNGTFRGNNLAFVGATAALDYWRTSAFEVGIREREIIIKEALHKIVDNFFQESAVVRGRGLFQGIAFADQVVTETLQKACLQKGLIIETSGAFDQVLKFMPALNIPFEELHEGLTIVYEEASNL